MVELSFCLLVVSESAPTCRLAQVLISLEPDRTRGCAVRAPCREQDAKNYCAIARALRSLCESVRGASLAPVRQPAERLAGGNMNQAPPPARSASLIPHFSIFSTCHSQLVWGILRLFDQRAFVSMAEIVGAVASGFTLAGVAVGSARTVIRLRQLWSEVKDVPQAVQGLMLKIELFESIILEMEQTVMVTLTDKELALGPDSAIARSTEHCQRQLKGLSDLINDLEAAITAQKRSKRAVAKVKVVLGGSRLTEFERRMRDVVDILVIAMNARILSVY